MTRKKIFETIKKCNEREFYKRINVFAEEMHKEAYSDALDLMEATLERVEGVGPVIHDRIIAEINAGFKALELEREKGLIK